MRSPKCCPFRNQQLWTPYKWSRTLNGCPSTRTPQPACKQDFVVGVHPADPDVIVVGGFAGEGFKFGPAIGEMAACLVTGASFKARPNTRKGNSLPCFSFMPLILSSPHVLFTVTTYRQYRKIFTALTACTTSLPSSSSSLLPSSSSSTDHNIAFLSVTSSSSSSAASSLSRPPSSHHINL